MDPLIRSYIEEIRERRLSEKILKSKLKRARNVPVPKNLKPAKPEDIIIDQVFWYPNFIGECKWSIVKTVIQTTNYCENFIATDDCLYDLVGAFVEIE